MGGADQLIGLHQLVMEKKPKPGDLIAAVGAGIGFMWTVGVLEVLNMPEW
ncbi:3-oxoacyl-[acyl-carrier-protein] synthase III C-terminal domain-containing protein [Frankia gtarii]|nr:3-oxoacyl-[acyl-carrier-protein] synthase III C-terminal domain-containing protein [Frankia gtarii]